MIIELPFKTPTINHLYWHRGNVKIMKKEAKDLRIQIEEEVYNQTKDIKTEDYNDKELKVIVEVFEDWYCLDQTIKKKDIQNREKFLIDSVFKALDLDDKLIFDCRFIKRQSNDEKAIIKIDELNDELVLNNNLKLN